MLFLITVAQRVLLRFLPPFKDEKKDAPDQMSSQDAESQNGRATVKHFVMLFVLTVAISAAGVGLSLLFTGKLNEALVILIVTTLGICGSFIKKLRNMPGSYDMGQYLLLIFCVAIGSGANAQRIINAGPMVFGIVALVMFGAIALHFLLAALFRIDADTVIITSTAAIMGPPFVGPIADALKNRKVVVSGLTSGLVGYAVGNYLGFALAWLLG